MEQRAPTLPTPAENRVLIEESGIIRATNRNRPSPVIVRSLSLFVKYGINITIVETQTQSLIREQVRGQVTVPEVFGWTEDRGRGFIYRALIEGTDLQDK